MGSAHQHGGLLMGARGWVAKNSGVARSTALMNGRGAKNGTRIGTLSPTSAESVSLSLNFSSETATESFSLTTGMTLSLRRAEKVANSALTHLFWQIGKRINDEILQNKRADYGK